MMAGRGEDEDGMESFRWHMPTEVVFGRGCLDDLGALCGGVGKRPLLVTGRHSARKCGALARVESQFPQAVLFDQVEENPSAETCDAGGAACREAGCDFVIGIGGGSPMDAAKAISLLACNPGSCERYYGREKFSKPNLPVVAVPTTAGTGSETTPYAVITHRREPSKRTIAGKTLFPMFALLDPTLSISMPGDVTANTGFDALSHALEGMASKAATPVGDVLGLDVCRLVRKWLPRAVAAPEDLEARGHMLYASMLAGCIIAQSGTTPVHGMGYYFTLAYGMPHGLANALLLPPLFQHNAEVIPAKVAAMATALGRPCNGTPEAAGANIVAALVDLARDCGLSLIGRDAGVQESDIASFASELYADRGRFKNQPDELSLDDVARFFRAALEGPEAL